MHSVKIMKYLSFPSFNEKTQSPCESQVIFSAMTLAENQGREKSLKTKEKSETVIWNQDE